MTRSSITSPRTWKASIFRDSPLSARTPSGRSWNFPCSRRWVSPLITSELGPAYLLQPEGDVGRVADDLRCVVHMAQRRLADDRHSPVCTPMRTRSGSWIVAIERSLSSFDGAQKCQAGAHRACSLVLRREGISELRANAVADVVDDVAPGIVDASGADGLEFQQNLAQVLRVATLGETCRIYDIAEQNSELAAFTGSAAKVRPSSSLARSRSSLGGIWYPRKYGLRTLAPSIDRALAGRP